MWRCTFSSFNSGTSAYAEFVRCKIFSTIEYTGGTNGATI